jgi:hypothetical protein
LIPYSTIWLIKAKDLTASKSDAEMKEFIAVHLLKEVLLQSGSKLPYGKTVEQTVLILLQF